MNLEILVQYGENNLKVLLSTALLAQLVARGSDKAKVIGSSPVESNLSTLLINYCFTPF